MPKELKESALDAILTSYFSADNVTKLSSIYLSILSNLPKLDGSEGAQVLKCVLSFLLTFLVEQGALDLSRSWPYELEMKKNASCQITSIPEYCSLISDKNDVSRWTHLVLLITGHLRNKQLVVSPGDRTVDVPESDEYISKARLVLYGLLVQRLAIDLSLTKSATDRKEIQSLLFFAIVYFYSDYVNVKQSDLDMTRWNSMYETIVKSYLGNESLFEDLDMNLGAYLDQDLISSVKGCIDLRFLNTYPFFTGFESPDTKQAMVCLKNLNLNSWSRHFNRWFRSLVESKVIDYTLRAGNTLYNNVAFSSRIAFQSGRFIYSTSFPSASYIGSVAIGLVAFTGALGSTQIVNVGNLTYTAIKSAIVYAFKKQTLGQESEEIVFTRPRKAAKLIWVRSADNSYSSMFAYYPLPQIESEQIKDFGFNAGQFKQQGGRKAVSSLKIQTQFTASDEILVALKKGYLKQEVCAEMQEYISKRLKIRIQVGGGLFTEVNLLEGEIYSGEVTQTEIDMAVDVCEIISYEDEYKLIMPQPPLLQEAFEKSAVMDLPTPEVDLAVLTGHPIKDDFGDTLYVVASPFAAPDNWNQQVAMYKSDNRVSLPIEPVPIYHPQVFHYSIPKRKRQSPKKSKSRSYKKASPKKKSKSIKKSKSKSKPKKKSKSKPKKKSSKKKSVHK